MVKQYIVYLMSTVAGMVTHRLNCANEDAALNICEGLFPNHRVIDIVEA